MISGASIIAKRLQNILTVLLVAGYIFSGAYGPGSVHVKFFLTTGEPAFCQSGHTGQPSPFKPTGARKHIASEKRNFRACTEAVLIAQKDWAVKENTLNS